MGLPEKLKVHDRDRICLFVTKKEFLSLYENYKGDKTTEEFQNSVVHAAYERMKDCQESGENEWIYHGVFAKTEHLLKEDVDKKTAEVKEEYGVRCYSTDVLYANRYTFLNIIREFIKHVEGLSFYYSIDNFKEYIIKVAKKIIQEEQFFRGIDVSFGDAFDEADKDVFLMQVNEYDKHAGNLKSFINNLDIVYDSKVQRNSLAKLNNIPISVDFSIDEVWVQERRVLLWGGIDSKSSEQMKRLDSSCSYNAMIQFYNLVYLYKEFLYENFVWCLDQSHDDIHDVSFGLYENINPFDFYVEGYYYKTTDKKFKMTDRYITETVAPLVYIEHYIVLMQTCIKEMFFDVDTNLQQIRLSAK